MIWLLRPKHLRGTSTVDRAEPSRRDGPPEIVLSSDEKRRDARRSRRGPVARGDATRQLTRRATKNRRTFGAAELA